MLNRIFICVLIAVAASSFVVSQRAVARPLLGIGAIIGTTTGFTAKYIQDRQTAYDGDIGWGDMDNYRIIADRLWPKAHFFKVNNQWVGSYWGLGGRIRDRGNNHAASSQNGIELGPRVMGGLNYVIPHSRVEVFGELGLVMDVIPATDADLEIGLGGRYYF